MVLNFYICFTMNRLLEDFDDIFTFIKKGQVVCNFCSKKLTFRTKQCLRAHLKTKKHSDNVAGISNTTFYEDLCEAFVSANIPLKKINHPVFKQFMKKYTGRDLPDESTIRKYYVPKHYAKTISKIKTENCIWLSTDETAFIKEEMAPAYKLTYFPVEALAEPIRFLFSYGGIEFEDFRFERENWPQIKPNMPFGQVPVLEHNGKTVNQSMAIARYAAKKVKLVGDDEWEDLEIDAIIYTVDDLRQKIALYHYESDAAIKESRKEPLFKETLPYYLQRLDAVVKANNGHLALGKLTWADLYFVALLNYLNAMCGGIDILADYPNLTALKNTVLDLPAIKTWVEKRPNCDM